MYGIPYVDSDDRDVLDGYGIEDEDYDDFEDEEYDTFDDEYDE